MIDQENLNQKQKKMRCFHVDFSKWTDNIKNPASTSNIQYVYTFQKVYHKKTYVLKYIHMKLLSDLFMNKKTPFKDSGVLYKSDAMPMPI